MTKSVKLNIARYVVSILLPLCLVQYPLIALGVAVLLLFLNNVADDYSFYCAGKEVCGRKISAVSSPVNGIITQIERNVPLFAHIRKEDVLTREEYFKVEYLASKYDKKHEKWNHVTIFLDKFSHHIVVNPSNVKSIQRLFEDGRLEEMVHEGKLIADNKGKYIGNRAVIIEYEDMIAVLTLDKYVSEYSVGSDGSGEVGLNILRGSQCDLYSRRSIEHYSHKKGDVIQIGEKIFKSSVFDKEYTVHQSSVYFHVTDALKHIGGEKQIWKTNVQKTLATFRSKVMLVTAVVGVSLSIISHPFAYVAFSSVYLFVFDRFYRHLMYSLMNARGYKPWMTKTYSIIHKVSVLWKK